MTVRNSGDTGIHLCTVEGDTEVRTSVVIGATTGIDTSGDVFGSGGIVSIVQTGVRDTTFGILLRPINFGESYVRGSFVQNAFGTGVGISLGGVGGGATTIAEVSDTTIRGCDGCLRAITAVGAGDVLIARDTIREWAEVAINVAGVPSVTIEDNVIRNIGGGLFFDGAIVLRNQSLLTGTLIDTTLIRDTIGGPGIHLICAAGVAVEDSVVLNTDGDGVLIDDVAPAGFPCSPGVVSQADVIRHTLILAAAGNGVTIATGYGYTLTDNVALASAVDGFNIASAVVGCCGVEGAYLTDNVGRASGDDGFQLDTASLELITNTGRNNTGFGFETNFAGPVDVDNGQIAFSNTAGNCSDPSDLPNSPC